MARPKDLEALTLEELQALRACIDAAIKKKREEALAKRTRGHSRKTPCGL
jgi:hypothetical protein